ncbi:MAG TPA: GntR family transcriptional regulator [Terriglobales bacterium]|jgi:GntR family transcriptional regulator
MRLWLTRDSGIPIRQQLVTQIMLGIVSRDLKPGERMPSTREIARRFRIHANTVSAAYQQLEEEKWLEFRHGSGVYVRDTQPKHDHAALDPLITELAQSARQLGVTRAQLRDHLQSWIEEPAPDHFLLIEPDEQLRRILIFEMQQHVHLRVDGTSAMATDADTMARAVLVVRPSRREVVEQAIPSGADMVVLEIRSVTEPLAAKLKPDFDGLIGIASCWQDFLDAAATMLTSASIAAEQLVLRNTTARGWLRGLDSAAVVICDALTASELSGNLQEKAIPFALISEASLTELQQYEHWLGVTPEKAS